MATAISFMSESSDRYLQLFDRGESVDQIMEALKEYFGDELGYIWVEDVASSEYDFTEIAAPFDKMSAEALDEEDF